MVLFSFPLQTECLVWSLDFILYHIEGFEKWHLNCIGNNDGSQEKVGLKIKKGSVRRCCHHGQRILHTQPRASAEWRGEQDKCSNILELGSEGLAEQVDAGGEIQGVSHGK